MYSKNTEIGFPALPEAKNRLLFALIRKWLRWCDEEHDCINSKTKNKLPTRLIYVGNPDDPNHHSDSVCLVDTRKQHTPGEYVALSHCWGTPTPEQKQAYCTTRNNYIDRQKSFRVDSLPLNFREAIKVTQELRKPYLWIDSCCIIQDDLEDWEVESKHMEDIFSSAYCTIAATSAENSENGFLGRNNERIYVQDGPTGKIHVYTGVACFTEEVENARINNRAWVMQERFLSRRTIHFGHRQAYLQCGRGIFCEDLTFLFR